MRSGTAYEPGPEHVLLGNPLPRELLYLQHWWDLLRGSMLWNIWIHRNTVVFQNEYASTSQTAIACKVWCQMRRYISISFSCLRRKLRSANVAEADRLKAVFTRTWDSPPLGPHVHLPKMDLPAYTCSCITSLV
jgi:hypothetical protein